MEDKKISEQESLQIISEMIQNSRRRIEIGDGNIYLYWGALSLVVLAIVWICFHYTHEPATAALWSLMALGWLFVRKMKHPTAARSYVDSVTASIWKSVGGIAVILAVVSLYVRYFTPSPILANPFFLFYFYPFFFVGFGVMAQGFLLKIRALNVGGILSISIGSYLLAEILSGSQVTYNQMMLALAFAFIVMLIIPGIALRAKARKEK